MATPTSKVDKTPWILCYWPGIKGRGEYVRLVFAEAGVEWEEMGGGFDGIVKWVWGGGNTGFPVRYPPAIQHGDFTLCGTPVIMAYLGRKLGLMPASVEDQAHVDMILAVVTDAVAEGRLAFHPKAFYKTHKIQVEESKPYIEEYGKERLPKHMLHFEAILKHGGATTEQGFLVGGSISVADLAVYHLLCAAQQHYREYYDSVDAPLAKALQARIASRPRIAAYLASERCQPWDTDSMM